MKYLGELVSALLLFTPSAYCWGSLGHRTIAYLAEMYLTPTASSFVSHLLNGEDISEAALWADKVKHQHGFEMTGAWHFIDARDDPPKTCDINFNRDCSPSEGCIISAIMNQTSRMINPALTLADHGQSLRYLLHFIGDIHQPLHTEGEEKGGNGIHVLFGRKHVNLHAIWDTDILVKHAGRNHETAEEEADAAKAWAINLFSADNNPGTSLTTECQDLTQSEDCALLWAGEANSHICSYVLKDDLSDIECAHDANWRDCKNLAEDYYDGAVPIVEDLISKAGRRLSAWLNSLAEQNAASLRTQPVGAFEEDL